MTDTVPSSLQDAGARWLRRHLAWEQTIDDCARRAVAADPAPAPAPAPAPTPVRPTRPVRLPGPVVAPIA